MAFLANNECYASRLEAAQAVCGTFPQNSFAGTTFYTWSCTGTNATGTQLTIQRTTNGTTAPTSTFQVLNFPSCTRQNFYTDSAELWALGLVAVVTVWALKNTVLKLFFPA
jgi:hypothetical protein